MNFNKKDLLLILLSLFTVLVWIIPVINPLVYLFIFIYFYLSKRPVSWYIIIILFSIPAYHFDSIYLADYPLTVILFFLVLLRKKDLKELSFGQLGLLLAIYAFYALLSVFWSRNALDSLFGWFTLIEGLMMYFIIINSHMTIKKEDYFLISKLASYFMLTITLELLYYYATHDIPTIISMKSINLSWGISNYAALFFTLGIPLALYKYDGDRFLPVNFLLDFINVIGLILTLSRAAFLSTIAGMMIFIIYHFSWKLIKRYGLLSILYTALILIIQNPVKILKLIFTHFQYVNTNDSGRYKIWNIAFEAFKHSPIFGNGYYSASFISVLNNQYFTWFHNFILDIGVSLGIVGLLLMIWILAKVFKMTYKPTNTFIISIFASIMAILIDSLFDVGFNFWTCGVVMYLLIALAELSGGIKKSSVYHLFIT